VTDKARTAHSLWGPTRDNRLHGEIKCVVSYL
jgi:hypothetical protein